MKILEEILSVKGPVVGISYGAAAERYDRANIKAGDQQLLFQGLGTDLRQERSANNKMLNQKLSNFRSIELDFIQNAEKYHPDYAGFSEDKLKLTFAPMAEYLKGDTFLGKPEDIKKKITMALELSGGIKIGDPYTPFKEFETTTKQAINKGLETYSGLAYNTWQNQVGDLTYETPEYDQTAQAMEGLRITSYNFPQFYPTVRGLENPSMTVARMSLLIYNSRLEAEKFSDEAWKFDEIRQEKFDAIQKGPNPFNIGNAASLFEGIDETGFMKLITTDSPYLKALNSIAGQLLTAEPGTDQYNQLLEQSSNYIMQHVEYLQDFQKNVFKKYITEDALDIEQGERLSKTYIKNQFGDNAIKIHANHMKVIKKADITALGGTTSSLGIILPANAVVDQIPENDGRVQELFSFISVPQGMKDGVPLPKKWLAVSSTGVMFELPNVNAIENIKRGIGIEEKGRLDPFPKAVLPVGLATVEAFAAPSSELKAHAMSIIKYAMEGKLKLIFVSKSGDQYIEDSRYLKAMENAGLFGKNSTTGMPVKYFGQ